MEKKIVYKAVRHLGGKFYSYSVHDLPKVRLCYAIDETTVPKIGKIFCFETFKATRNFAPRATILECHTTEFVMSNSYTQLRRFWELTPAKLKDFWNNENSIQYSVPVFEGTVFCNNVIPFKIIQKGD